MGGVAVPDDETASGSWQPLSARLGGTPIDQTWREGIPEWIDAAVRSWLSQELVVSKIRDRLFARLHYELPSVPNPKTIRFDIISRLDEHDLLDWIDGVLHLNAYNSSLAVSDALELETLLREGHSVWKVSDKFDSLERRQDATVTSAAHRATETARSSGRPASAVRLEEAWSAAYGLHPEPSKAFSKAILAVEAVAVPVVVPNQADATLGHVLGQLKNQGHLYELAIVDKTGARSSVEAVTVLVSLLWEGHTDRHEGNRPALPITQPAAEMAVHAAAVLVQWFSSGAIRRKLTGSR